MRRLAGHLNVVLSGALGIAAFLYPFLLPSADVAGGIQQQLTPLLTVALVALSVVALMAEMQGQELGAKTVALLGILVAFASVLRFIEGAIPFPGGFSPVFAPIILVGYVFGSRFGFLMGAMTLLASALITGSVGPWLPFQMFSAGWAGLTAGWLPACRGRLRIAVVSAFGLVWGFLYGAIMNLYFWPLAQGAGDQTWAYGLGLGETLTRYAAFYTVTSLPWDVVRAVGNAVLLLVTAGPAVKVLERFKRRFHFEIHYG